MPSKDITFAAIKKTNRKQDQKDEKISFPAIIMIAALGVKAQNVQLHYDFGSALYDKELDGRPVVTTTVEYNRHHDLIITPVIDHPRQAS